MPKIYDLPPSSVNASTNKSSSPPSAEPPREPPDADALRAAILKTFALARAHAEALCSEPAGAVGEDHQVLAELIEGSARDALMRFEAQFK